MENVQNGDYFIVKALDHGVQVIGLTRGQDTRFHHTEKLDKGEVIIAQFTDHTSAVKIRGKAEIMTQAREDRIRHLRKIIKKSPAFWRGFFVFRVYSRGMCVNKLLKALAALSNNGYTSGNGMNKNAKG
ncbi:Tryptophan RNA-binding attenuator protein [Actinobacillus pleuropneumoniae]|nr:Tryptophan RNA-binding attenuator protein [Actinobacillus pleuropneumoniae]